MEPIISRAESLLKGVEENRLKPPAERVAWTIVNERELCDCLTAMLDFQAGYAADAQKTSLLALRLLKAIEPLLLMRGDEKILIEGNAPRLRSLVSDLKAHLEKHV